jgi:hypothetical protein
MRESLKPLIHYIIHILLIFAMIKIFANDYLSIITLIFGAAIIMFDNLPEVRKIGIKKYFYLRSVLDNWKYRKYFLHTPVTLVISLTLSILTLAPMTFYFGLFFFSMSIHLLLDLIEMKFMYKIPIRSWLFKSD